MRNCDELQHSFTGLITAIKPVADLWKTLLTKPEICCVWVPDCLLTRCGLYGLFALSTDNPRVSVIEEVQIPQKQTHRWHWKETAYQCRLPSALGRARLSQKGSLPPLSPRTGMRETCNTQRHCTKHSPAHTEPQVHRSAPHPVWVVTLRCFARATWRRFSLWG